MNVSKISNSISFAKVNKTEKPQKRKMLDKIPDYVKNQADMNDTVSVPRTIFKGYLSFIFGTSLLTIGNLFKNSKKLLPKILLTAGTVANLYGAYAFVRPFLIKDKKTEDEKEMDKITKNMSEKLPELPPDKKYAVVSFVD